MTHDDPTSELPDPAVPLLGLPEGAFLDQLLASEHLIVALKDREGRYVRISRLLERLWERFGVEVIGKTAREALPVGIGDIVHRDDCTVLQTQEANVYEQTFDLDGVDRTFLTSRFVLRDADGKVVGLCVVGGEITERKRYEQALRSAALGVTGARGEETYRQMVRFLATTLGVDLAFISVIDEPLGERAHALAVWHRDGFLDSFDYDLQGTPCATVVGKRFVFVEDGLGLRFPADLMMIRMGLVSYAAYPLFANDGTPLGLIAISDSRRLRDHDAIEAMLRIFSTRAAAELEREQRETALSKSEERFRTTVESALDCIVGMDAGGRIVEFNPAAEACFGYRREEALGQPLAELLIPEKLRGAHHRGLQRHQATGEGPYLGRRVEVTALRRDGSEFPAELAISTAGDSGEPLYIGYLRDITRHKRAEQERERLEEQLRQAQKMEAIGHLTGGIAHDFNNILTSILGYAVMAEERSEALGDVRLAHQLAQIRRSGERARDLIAQMLTFSRGKRGESRPVDPIPLVRETVKLFGSTFPSTIQLRLELEAGLSRVMSDPIQFEQVLVNLCINARDAIENRGRILISLRAREAVDRVCSSCRQRFNGDYIELAVHDDGIGIPDDVVDRIFDPFFTTKPTGKGSGMGLATTHGIVHEHGGHILVEAPPEGGTLFLIMMQRVPETTAEVPIAPAAIEPASETPRHAHLLLVEDEESVRGFMRDFLESRGYRVSEAVDGRAALEWFDARSERPDLVITDQTMPRMTGMELARALRERHGAIPTVLYTGYSDALTETVIAQSGLAGWLRKPVDPGELTRLLDRVLQG